MRLNHFLFTAMTAGIIFYSCKKDETFPKPSAASLSITSPADSSILNAGATLTIQASATNDVKLHGYSILIHSKTHPQDTTFFIDEDVHSVAVNIDTTWINSSPVDTVQMLEITAYLDHEGNKITKTKTITCR